MTNFAGDHEFVVQEKFSNPVTQYWKYGYKFFDDLLNQWVFFKFNKSFTFPNEKRLRK